MPQLSELLRSSYARVRAYLGRQAPANASPAPPLTQGQLNDLAQFEQARAFHQQGLLNEAAEMYRALLLKYPEHSELLHQLGMVYGQRNQFADAITFIKQAIVADPNNAAAHGSLGNCLKGLGRHEEALASYDRALALHPNDADVLSNRGATLGDLKRYEQALESYDRALAFNPNHLLALDNRGTTLRALQRLEEALASHDKALAINPDYVPAHYNRGLILADLKRLEEARASFEQALVLDPSHIGALISLGTALGEMEQYDATLATYDQALGLSPNDPALHYQRGCVLHIIKRYEEALASYQQALQLRPDFTEALVNLGATHRELGRHKDALSAFDRALELEPDHSNAHCYRGIVLDDIRRYQDALVSFDCALAFNAGSVEAHDNRGRILRQLRRYEEALVSHSKGLAINPNHQSSLFNRGSLLAYMGRREDAAADYERLVALSPDYEFAQGYLLQTKMSCCDWRGLDGLLDKIVEGVRHGKKSIEPFLLSSTSTSSKLLLYCAKIYASVKFPPIENQSSPITSRKNNKIRVGYVAGEFRQHALSRLLVELIERHDTSRFELYAFDNGWDDGSDIRKRLSKAFGEIVDIAHLNDAQAADVVRNKGIDILVDLNGHSGSKRAGVFSRRPAPIQVNWLGYPGTMGAPYMDYIIGDAHVIPEGHEVHYTEKVVRLPDTYQVNDSQRVISTRTPTRAEAGLPETAFVFCCFNSNYKITPEVFDVWMRLLNKVEHSVLWLFEDNPAAARNLRAEAAARGVMPDRLVFAPRMTLPDHLARHRLADLFVDTLPYNAHTTASDALWAGLPLLTCMGNTFPGRVAGSLLHAVGLPELITQNLEEYEALALKLATTPELLSSLRVQLSSNKASHPLFDTDRFRRHIESAYTRMVECLSRGEPPKGFNVSPQSSPSELQHLATNHKLVRFSSRRISKVLEFGV